MITISGTVRDPNGSLAVDVMVRAYQRGTGRLVAQTLTSDGATVTDGDEHYDAVGLLLNFDEDLTTNVFVDKSPSGRTITTHGDVRIVSEPDAIGGRAAYFGGNGGFLSGLNSWLPFGSGDWTIELRHKHVSRVQSYPCIFANYVSYAAGSVSIFPGHGGWATDRYQINLNASGAPSIASPAGSLITSWREICLCNHDGLATLLLDGWPVGQKVTTGMVLNGVGANWYFGTSLDSTASSYIQAYIQRLRITLGVARHTDAYTPDLQLFPDAAALPPKPLGQFEFRVSSDGIYDLLYFPPDGSNLPILIKTVGPSDSPYPNYDAADASWQGVGSTGGSIGGLGCTALYVGATRYWP